MYKLTKASKKAIDFACKNYHYSKSVPVNTHWYNVYYNSEWCWVIVYWLGANNNLSKAFGMKQWEVVELVRVALNWKQKNVSKPLSISLKLVKRDLPMCKFIVSYADEWQWHHWGIYQATNWIFIWDSFAESAIDPADWKVKHTRILHSKYWSIKWFTRVKDKAKHKYIYPLTKELRNKYIEQAKEYPK